MPSSTIKSDLHNPDLATALSAARQAHTQIRNELSKIVVGQEDVLDELLVAIFCGAHALVEGVPGLAKTLIISTMAKSLSLRFARIQFTPDLMPSDVTGSEVIQEDRETGSRQLRFVRGPVFANVILADEINRTPPKTQSALLEAMQEGQVTCGGIVHPLPRPFFVLATQNPIEQEGTYPLPEAQLDRFMFHVQIGYPTQAQEAEIVRRTTGKPSAQPEPVLDEMDCLRIQELVRQIPIADHLIEFALRIVRSTRQGEGAPPAIRDYLSWGAGPRASQFLVLAAKAWALLEGEDHVQERHLRRSVPAVLRHRIVTSFNAQADGVSRDDVVRAILEHASLASNSGAGSVAASRLVN